MKLPEPTKVYVASSWRNERQKVVVDELRSTEGFSVYDFKNPQYPNPGTGFAWTDIEPNWKRGDITPAHEIRHMLRHPISIRGFNNDIGALEECDICLLVLPSGRSAHLEAGWAAGAGKFTIALIEDGEPDLMWKMCDVICVEIGEAIDVCRFWRKKRQRSLGRKTPAH